MALSINQSLQDFSHTCFRHEVWVAGPPRRQHLSHLQTISAQPRNLRSLPIKSLFPDRNPQTLKLGSHWSSRESADDSANESADHDISYGAERRSPITPTDMPPIAAVFSTLFSSKKQGLDLAGGVVYVDKAVCKAQILSCCLVKHTANQLELDCPANAPLMPCNCPADAYEPFEATACRSPLRTIIRVISMHSPWEFVAPNSSVSLSKTLRFRSAISRHTQQPHLQSPLRRQRLRERYGNQC
jgi:hypothetical protein